jgi:hypothetical protein
MPVLSHQQIHELLVAVAAVQHLNGEVFAQTPPNREDRFHHGHFVAALHAMAGTGEPATVSQLLACMVLARMAQHPPDKEAQNRAWELAQVRRLFPG